TDRRLMGADPIAAVRAWVARSRGELTVQVREKDLDARVLYAWVEALLELRVRVMVNGRVDVARCFDGRVGVHLPEDGLSVRDARAVLGPEVAIGRSVHDEAGAVRAVEEGADLLTVAPVFEKKGATPLGLEGLTRIVLAAREAHARAREISTPAL